MSTKFRTGHSDRTTYVHIHGSLIHLYIDYKASIANAVVTMTITKKKPNMALKVRICVKVTWFLQCFYV